MKNLFLLILLFLPLALFCQQKELLINSVSFSRDPELASFVYSDRELSFKTLTIKESAPDFLTNTKFRKVENLKSNKEVPEILFGLSSGLMTSNNNNVFYGSLDINLNLAFIYKHFYLSGGAYMFPGYDAFGAQVTPSLGFNIFDDKLFTSAGAGLFFIFPDGTFYNLALRINYNITKYFSIGLDNRFVNYDSKSFSAKNSFLIGLNLTLKARD